MKKSTTISFILIFFLGITLNAKSIDSLQLFISNVESNPDLIIKNWESYFLNSEDNIDNQLSIIYAVSNAYRIKGDYGKMMTFADKSKELIKSTKSNEAIIKNKIFIASRYTVLKLYGKAEKELYSVYPLINRLNHSKSGKLKIELIGQLIFLYGMKGDNSKLIKYFDTIIPLTKKHYADDTVLKNRKLKAMYYNKALSYSNLQKRDSSKLNLKLALNIPHQIVDLHTDGYIYSKIGEQYLEDNKKDSSKYYLEKSIVVFNKIGDNYALYRSYALLNKLLSTDKGVEYYNSLEKLYNLQHVLNETERKAIDKEFLKIDTSVKEDNSHIIIISIGSIFIILIIFSYYRYGIRTGNKKIEEEKKKEASTQFNVSQEIEVDILRKLEMYEKSLKFLNSKTSLASLASHLQTNTQYLSHVINKNKNKNFNTYINHLRIIYIMNKLENDKIYRNYKIAHLAEITGFKNHSIFTKVFRSVANISPSEFIKNLD